MPWIQAICAATDGPDKPAMTAGERSALAVNVLIIHVISEMCVRPRARPGHLSRHVRVAMARTSRHRR